MELNINNDIISNNDMYEKRMYGRRQLIILMQNLRTAKPHFMYHFLATTTILPKSFFWVSI